MKKRKIWSFGNISMNKEGNKGEKKEKDSSSLNFLEEDDSLVQTEQNRIYFYTEVGRKAVLELNRTITELDTEIVEESNRYGVKEYPSIKLYISSFGGSVFDAFGAIDYIRNTKAPVHSIIDGYAASAATLMSVCAKKRFINKNAFMLIHQLSGMNYGTYEQMKDDNKNNERLMELIRNIYAQYTEIPKKKLNEILKRDLWFDAETCLSYGLVDEILE